MAENYTVESNRRKIAQTDGAVKQVQVKRKAWFVSYERGEELLSGRKSLFRQDDVSSLILQNDDGIKAGDIYKHCRTNFTLSVYRGIYSSMKSDLLRSHARRSPIQVLTRCTLLNVLKSRLSQQGCRSDIYIYILYIYIYIVYIYILYIYIYIYYIYIYTIYIYFLPLFSSSRPEVRHAILGKSEGVAYVTH